METNEVTIDISIEEAQSIVNRAKALDRLMENKDFQELIVKGYLEQEAVRITQALANPAMDSRRNSLLEQLLAISHLQQYFNAMRAMGKEYSESLKELYELKDNNG